MFTDNIIRSCIFTLRHEIVNTLYFVHLVVNLEVRVKFVDVSIIILDLTRKACVYVSQRLYITQFDDVGRILLQQYVVPIDFTNIKKECTRHVFVEVLRLSQLCIVSESFDKLVESQVDRQADGKPLTVTPIGKVWLHVSSQIQSAMHKVVCFEQSFLTLILIDKEWVASSEN